MKRSELIQQAANLAQNPQLLEEIIKTLDFTIKDDYPTKIAIFFTGISAYLKEPINLFLRGESSIGKSYNATEVLSLFPAEDVWKLGGLSPTALIHQYGDLIGADGKKIDESNKPHISDYRGDLKGYRQAMREWREKLIKNLKNSYELVDLTGKILLFLESPNRRTFNMLRPILSHDSYRISYKFTDKNSKGSLRTHHTIIQGWPATIFLSAKDQVIEELATRSFTCSPVETSDKFAAANKITNLKSKAPWIFDEQEEKKNVIRELIRIVKKNIEERDVIIPYNIHAFYPSKIRRDMRDFQHLNQLIKCVTALYFYQRPKVKRNDKEYYLAAPLDVEFAFNLMSVIIEPTRTGVSQKILDFYHNIIKKREQWLLKDLVTEYNAVFTPKRSGKTIRRYLGHLEDIGYITCEEDEEDKRKNLFIPLLKNGEKRTNVDILKLSEITSLKLEKDLKEWTEQFGHECRFYIWNFAEGDKGGYMDASCGLLTKFLLKQNLKSCPYLNNLFSKLKNENKPVKTDISEMSINVHNSEGKNLDFVIKEILEQSGNEVGLFLFQESLEKQGFEWNDGVLRALSKLEREGKIIRTENTIALGREWFGGV